MSVGLCFIAYVIQKKCIYYLTLCDGSSLNFPADFEILLFGMGLIHCGLFEKQHTSNNDYNHNNNNNNNNTTTNNNM